MLLRVAGTLGEEGGQVHHMKHRTTRQPEPASSTIEGLAYSAETSLTAATVIAVAYFHPEEIENESPAKAYRPDTTYGGNADDADRKIPASPDSRRRTSVVSSHTRQASSASSSTAASGPASAATSSPQKDARDIARIAAEQKLAKAQSWGSSGPPLAQAGCAASAWDATIPSHTNPPNSAQNAWGDYSPVNTATGNTVGAAAWGSPSPPPNSSGPMAQAGNNMPTASAPYMLSIKGAAIPPQDPRFATPVSTTSEVSSRGTLSYTDAPQIPRARTFSGSIGRVPNLAAEQSVPRSMAIGREQAGAGSTKAESLSPQMNMHKTFAGTSLKQEAPSTASEEEVDELAEDDNTTTTASKTPISPDIMSILARARSKPARYLSSIELIARFDREFPDWLPAR